MASSTFFIPSVNVIGADSLTDAMNMMADYGFTRTLIVTDTPPSMWRFTVMRRAVSSTFRISSV